MRRELRLTDGRRFFQIRLKGRGWANNLLVLKALPNERGQTRFGLITGKRIGKAVVRNRVKRRLREILRQSPVREGWDLVFIARKGVEAPNFCRLRGAAQDLLLRAGLFEAPCNQEGDRY